MDRITLQRLICPKIRYGLLECQVTTALQSLVVYLKLSNATNAAMMKAVHESATDPEAICSINYATKQYYLTTSIYVLPAIE